MLTGAHTTPKMLLTDAAHVFLNNWLIAYGTPDIVLPEHGQQFVRKFAISSYYFLGVKKSRWQRTTDKQTIKWNVIVRLF